MEKKKKISEYKKDDFVNDIFVVKFKKPIEEYKNGYKFELRLGDNSKEIMYKFWGPSDKTFVENIYNKINKNDVVFVEGRINEWNNNLEISANFRDQIKVLSPEEYKLEWFIKKSENIDELWNDFLEMIKSINNKELKAVLEYLFIEDKEFAKKFKNSSAAMYLHHNWIGGLVEHSLDVAKICDFISKFHKIDRDLTVCGALLHDIGKIKEFEIKTSINISSEGILLGHVSLGLEILNDVFEKLEKREIIISEIIKLKLKHIILTHMGEYGSSKNPAFPEAMAVFYADQLDAGLNQMELLKESANTEDNFLYNKNFGNIFLK